MVGAGLGWGGVVRTRLRRRGAAVVATAVGLGLVVWAGAAVVAGAFAPPKPAGAAVEHGVGFAATVDGYRSWYGSYRLGELGEVWCVDHGIAAPDVVLGYEPTALDDRAPDTRRAVAWAVGRHGHGADRVTAAALMLVLHDLMGARYPSGVLSVDRLTDSDLVGFGDDTDDVLARARLIKADAVSRAGLVGPLRLSVSTTGGEVAGREGVLRATLVDAGGVPLGGVRVHPTVEGAELSGEVDRTTGEDGAVEWPFVSGPEENRFSLSADVPGAELVALQPTLGAAQRVARPAGVVVEASRAFVATVPRTFTIHKRGDAELPVTGARFTVSGVEGDLVVGPDGRTPPLSLLPGTYTVTEVAPPPGYDADGPWEVTVNDADVVLEVLDRARRGELVVTKVDAVTRQPVAGATFEVRPRGAGPADVVDPTKPLFVGTYEVHEVAAPPHYRRHLEPVVVEVRAGERAEAVVPNQPLATVGFDKRPPLAGASFAVLNEAGDELGRCTTGPDGRCSLPEDALDAHARHCWREVSAPPGWGLAEGGCLTSGPAGSVTTVAVDEPPLPAPPPPQPTGPPPAPAPVEATPATIATPAPAPAASPPGEAPAEAPAPPPAVVLSAPPLDRRPAELPRTGVPIGRIAGFGLGVLAIGIGLCALAMGRGYGEGSQLVG